VLHLKDVRDLRKERALFQVEDGLPRNEAEFSAGVLPDSDRGRMEWLGSMTSSPDRTTSTSTGPTQAALGPGPDSECVLANHS